MATEKTLDDLFLDTLKDIYYAEKQIVKTLPKMAKAAQSEELRMGFEQHAVESEGHVERLEQIFEPFKRLHSVSAYEGTGLGLAICKRIVEKYGGRIWVESAVGSGASFRFTLPDARPIASDQFRAARQGSS